MQKHFSKIKFFLLFALLLIPIAAMAFDVAPTAGDAISEGSGQLTQPPQTPNDLSSMVCIVVKLALAFIPYLVVIAVGAFLQGLVKYVGHGDDEEKMSEGRKLMIYGIFGFFFMVSIWGILGLFTASFDLPLAIPQFKADRSFVCAK
jgi:hypothetical protein